MWQDGNLVQEFKTDIMDLSSSASVSPLSVKWKVTWKLTCGIRQRSSWRLGLQVGDLWNLRYSCPSKKQISKLEEEIRVTKSEFRRQSSYGRIQDTEKYAVFENFSMFFLLLSSSRAVFL